MNARQAEFIFCEFPVERIIASNALALAIRDKYPVTQSHTLVITKRHAATLFDLIEPKRRTVNRLLDALRHETNVGDVAVSDFKFGMNSG